MRFFPSYDPGIPIHKVAVKEVFSNQAIRILNRRHSNQPSHSLCVWLPQDPKEERSLSICLSTEGYVSCFSHCRRSLGVKIAYVEPTGPNFHGFFSVNCESAKQI